MKLTKSERREKKRRNNNKMKISGYSVKSILQNMSGVSSYKKKRKKRSKK